MGSKSDSGAKTNLTLYPRPTILKKYGDIMHAEVAAQGQQHYVDNQEPGIGHEIR